MPALRRNSALDLASESGLTPQDLHDLPDVQLRQILITAPSKEAPSGSRVGDAAWIWSESLRSVRA